MVASEWQNYYNAEPFWGSLGCMDLGRAMKDAGFKRVLTGFQPRTGNFRSERGKLTDKAKGGLLSHWLVFGGLQGGIARFDPALWLLLKPNRLLSASSNSRLKACA